MSATIYHQRPIFVMDANAKHVHVNPIGTNTLVTLQNVNCGAALIKTPDEKNNRVLQLREIFYVPYLDFLKLAVFLSYSSNNKKATLIKAFKGGRKT